MEEHAGRYTTNQDNNPSEHVSNKSTPPGGSWPLSQDIQVTWQRGGGDNQALPGGCSKCVVGVLSKFTYKWTPPIIITFILIPPPPCFLPHRTFHRLKSGDYNSTKTRPTIYNNYAGSCHHLCTFGPRHMRDREWIWLQSQDALMFITDGEMETK